MTTIQTEVTSGTHAVVPELLAARTEGGGEEEGMTAHRPPAPNCRAASFFYSSSPQGACVSFPLGAIMPAGHAGARGDDDYSPTPVQVGGRRGDGRRRGVCSSPPPSPHLYMYSTRHTRPGAWAGMPPCHPDTEPLPIPAEQAVGRKTAPAPGRARVLPTYRRQPRPRPPKHRPPAHPHPASPLLPPWRPVPSLPPPL